MPTVFWILGWALVVGGIVFFAICERRTGRRVAPEAVRRRRDDSFRMHTAAIQYQSEMPEKDPDRGSTEHAQGQLAMDAFARQCASDHRFGNVRISTAAVTLAPTRGY